MSCQPSDKEKKHCRFTRHFIVDTTPGSKLGLPESTKIIPAGCTISLPDIPVDKVFEKFLLTAYHFRITVFNCQCA